MPGIKFKIKGEVLEQLLKAKSTLMQFARDLNVAEEEVMEWIDSNELPTQKIIKLRKSLNLTKDELNSLWAKK